MALRRRSLLAAPAAALAVVAHAQVAAGAGPATELAIRGGALPEAQRLVRVARGDRVRWRITSDTPGEFHLHAYRLAATVQPGGEAVVAFTANATGRFRASWHPAGAAGTGRHDAALLVLEVHPR